MLEFCGQEKCLIDANGRLKLSPRFLKGFKRAGLSVVMHCWPEGNLGIYPENTWQQMRQNEPRPAAKAAESVLFRRQQRRTAAFTMADTISNQGRITIPSQFRPVLDQEAGTEVFVVGSEIGIEVWNAQRWLKELQIIDDFELKRAEAEMSAGLAGPVE